MAVDTTVSPVINPDDPYLQMGLDLEAYRRRQRLIHSIRISIVWAVIVMFMMVALLLLNFSVSYILQHYQFLLIGAVYTIGISLASIAIATVLALLGALGRLSHNAIAQGVSSFYVSIFRGTPLLIQIYLIYLGLPQIGAQLSKMGFPFLGNLFILTAVQSGILALSLNYGAYMTEIFRAGIQSIPFGQREAAISVGMSSIQTMRRVILPQAVRIIIPDIGNQFIAMQKDSALVSIMGVWEMTYRANRLGRVEGRFMEMFLLAALMYWILTIISSCD